MNFAFRAHLLIIFSLLSMVLFRICSILFRAIGFLFGKHGGNEGVIAKTQPSPLIYWVSRNLARLWLRAYHKMTIKGAKNCPLHGPLVIVANHSSALDGYILGSCLPIPISIMVKRESFENPICGWYLRKVMAFPVDRSKPDPSAIKNSIKILQEGKALALFPEGTRHPHGKVRPFKPGAIRLAIKHKAPILPAFIDGNHLIFPDGAFIPHPVQLRVAFGPLIDVPTLLNQNWTEQQISDYLYQEVTRLGHQLRGEDVRDLSCEPVQQKSEAKSERKSSAKETYHNTNTQYNSNTNSNSNQHSYQHN